MNRATLFSFVIAGALSVGLFFLKYEVHGLEAEIIDLRRTMAADRQALHVLKAEWAHLNDPQRLKGLVQRHLDLVPIQPRQISSLDLLPAIGSTPVASDPVPQPLPGRVAQAPGVSRR